ncbi:hypothetical protein JEQ21_01790 [Streptococcus sp. 121]|uniref:phage tail assembly chaperone G n=1 Tax=Streptococcus sp. 121 TaxID=2797637 RepID=UPI0018F061B9|nr:hypothetical protein [Streptococcus sp. 121]MBJ6745203.1 hypothetical protein [Streptococcus sp. 121]
MAKVEFFIKNEAGKEEIRRSKEITTRDYRDYLVMNEQIENGNLNEVEKLDAQLEFLSGLFEDVTVEELLEHTDYAQLFEIFVKVYEHLVGNPSQEGKD